MKVLFPCPSCHRLLQPPTQASGSAKLRCPLCQHEMQAYDLVQGANRTWLVLEDPGGEDLFRPFQGYEEAPRSTSHEDHVEYHLANDEKMTEDRPLAIADGSVDHASPIVEERQIHWEKFKPITHEEFQRRRRAAKSPLASILQVVLGGLAAIPVSLLILWYGLGKDVGDAGPWVSQYAPWIVPKKLQGNARFEDGLKRIRKESGGTEFQGLSKFETDEGSESGGMIVADRVDRDRGSNDPSKDSPAEVESGGVPSGESAGGDPRIVESRKAGGDLEPPTSLPPLALAVQEYGNAGKAWLEYRGTEQEIQVKLRRNYVLCSCEMAKQICLVSRPLPNERVWVDQFRHLFREHAAQEPLWFLIEKGGSLISDSKVGSGVALVVEIESFVREGDRVRLRTTTPIKIRDKELEAIAMVGETESDSEIGGRFPSAKVVLFGIVEEVDGKSVLSVGPTAMVRRANEPGLTKSN